ncbi:NAD-dependent epimerase/dehydratase family protein [Waltera acetigignens]
MKILVIGGTRYFGIHMVNKLLEQGHEVTIATRGKTPDSYGDKVERITIQRTNEESMRHFDVVIDKIAYCSNDIRYVMDYVDCDKYIYMSSTSVYNPKHMNTVESDFDGYSKDFVWCGRKEFPYEEIKRQAEYALWQKYLGKNWIAVRYPFAIGKDDYTKRLLFYVEHVIKSEPMYIDNIDYQMSYIRSDEAGDFIAYLVDKRDDIEKKIRILETYVNSITEDYVRNILEKRLFLCKGRFSRWDVNKVKAEYSYKDKCFLNVQIEKYGSPCFQLPDSVSVYVNGADAGLCLRVNKFVLVH